MSISTWIDRNRTAATVLAIVLCMLAGSLMLWSLSGDQAAVSRVYFYDVDQGKLTSMPAGTTSPVEGANVFRAGVFACGECSDDPTLIRYLIKGDQFSIDQGKTWLPAGDSRVQRVMNQFCDGGNPPTPCYP